MILGASLYLNTYDKEYLLKLEQKGYKYIFTSLHIPEDDFKEDVISEILDFSKRSNISLMVDVSPETLKKLNVLDILELKGYNISTIRLDYGFDDVEYVKVLSESFEIVLNASVLKASYIKSLVDVGVDVTRIKALHNFYPKVNTGLDEEKFSRLNDMLTGFGIEVFGFVAGDAVLRYPTYEGLVTLEKHRGMCPYVAAVELYRKYQVSGVFVGDGVMSDVLLDRLQTLSDNNTIEIKCSLFKEYEYLYDNPVRKRVDSNSRVSRLLTRSGEAIEQANCLVRERGNIAITNGLYGRYAGEVEVSNSSLGFDSRFNTIGYVLPSDLGLLDMLDHYDTIIFRRI